MAAASAVPQPIHWADLGLKRGIDLGFFTLRYYSLAYLAGIILAYWHTLKMIRQPGAPLAQRHADDLFFWCTMGVIVGGRLGYATFYGPQLWLHPLDLLKLWEGGMSFHGGLIGVLAAIGWVSWRNGLSFIRVCDYIGVCTPFGLLFGRIANFINGELWGRVAGPGVRWAMVFPGAGDLPRHPSQLYEAGLEGAAMAVLLLTLFWKTRARWRPGLLAGAGLMWYGCSRFVIEFFREPDEQLQEFARQTHMSMGQWLTVPMIVIGLILVLRALIRPEMGKVAAVPA
ncbi:MAG: prolipoprotein diacylglyceryl transferase [Sphingomonadales bacterium]|nr:prolipoprotein diacylglyceryl transferase [Sphingomonadales bacterium]